MRFMRREIKDTRKIERGARDNGNVTDGKSGKQRAMQRKREGRTGSRAKTRNATKRDGGERTGGK